MRLSSASTVGFRDVLAVREFRVLYLTQSLSVVGDQLARIAVAAIVFNRTQSSLLTGTTYALSYLPWVIGGPSLSIVADRWERKTVIVLCDSLRAALISLAAIGLPTLLLLCLVAAVALLQPPHAAARGALIPEILGEGATFTAASTLGNSTNQLAVVVGFAVGGAMTSSGGTSLTLLTDAVTFLAAAIAIARWVQPRPIVATAKGRWSTDIRQGFETVFGNSQLRWLATTAWIVVGTVIATEALAVPYAHSHRQGTVAAGILTAALPAGTFAGALLLGRVISATRAKQLMRPLAIAAPLTLSTTGFDAGIAATTILWFVVGAMSAMSVVANRIFIVTVAAPVRARAFGVAAAGVSAAQGIGTLLAGALARSSSPADAVSLISVLAVGLFVVKELPVRVRTCRRGAHSGKTQFGTAH